MNYIDAEIVKGTKKYKLSNNELTGTSLEVLSFVVGKVKKRSYFNSIDGRIGRVNYGIEDEHRTIRLTLQVNAYDEYDISHLRDEIFNLFDGEFYIREMRNSKTEVKYESIGSRTDDMNLGTSEYVNGKRYYVALISDFDIADLQKSEFVIEFETVTLPFAESTYTSLDLHNNKFNSETEIFGYVDGINDEMQDYIFTTNTFSLWNAGNVPVEPESMYLRIQLRDCISNGNLTIRNKTTGETFVYFPKIDYTRHYTLEGMTFLSANTNALRDTNLQFISLAPGKNDFEILNCTFSAVTFDFRFYYK